MPLPVPLSITVTLPLPANTVALASDVLTVEFPVNAVIGFDTGPLSITLSGSAAQINGGSGILSILNLGLADTIAAGIGSRTVTASGSDVVVIGGGGDLLFVSGPRPEFRATIIQVPRWP
jgi:hypothetical protein